ncbi:hypothetical protein C5748_05580 [Phyllobacterium phragmitis]|uniref:DUF1468 domain-containing protein n=1 Tax=Phyllobacterium phragmitis TaxID=2670329 RepID=A0A2S9IWF1_9HYPH|nr:tripartite tricarboxylate transporter TctB family protein [Phyllobacterium phragmitis]PRD44847.1 hypothetical protein C5748_05580 [Phyllobacterium phragmitis]
MGDLNRRLDPGAVLAALVMVAFGGFVAWTSTSYGLGSPRRMGAGYFPFLLGVAAMIVGTAILIFEGWRRQPAATPTAPAASGNHDDGQPWPGARWRPFVLVPLAVAAFGALVEQAGLMIAVAALIVISGLAAPRPKLSRLAVVTAAAPIGVWLIFVKGLGLPFKLF